MAWFSSKGPNMSILEKFYINKNERTNEILNGLYIDCKKNDKGVLNLTGPVNYGNVKLDQVKERMKQNIDKINFIKINTIIFNVKKIKEYKSKYIGKYFIGDNVFAKPFVENYSYLLHNKPLSYIPIKTKRISFIVSQKKDYWFGYEYRYKLLNSILEGYLPIDIYGRVCKNSNIKDARLKGVFNNNEPYEDYEFHICIENFITNAYFSEKIINPLLTNTIPIYLGCRNIKDYFGDSVIIMTGNIEEDMILIKDIINYPEKYRRNIDIEKIKKKVSLLHNLDSIFS